MSHFSVPFDTGLFYSDSIGRQLEQILKRCRKNSSFTTLHDWSKGRDLSLLLSWERMNMEPSSSSRSTMVEGFGPCASLFGVSYLGGRGLGETSVCQQWGQGRGVYQPVLRLCFVPCNPWFQEQQVLPLVTSEIANFANSFRSAWFERCMYSEERHQHHLHVQQWNSHDFYISETASESRSFIWQP